MTQLSKFTALQLCPLSSYLETSLAERLNVVHWYKLAPNEQEDWLQQHALSVRAVITGGHLGCNNDLIDAIPELGIIAINGVGFDKVDLIYSAKRKIKVTNTPDVLTDDVADLAVGLTIGLLRNLSQADRFVRTASWNDGELPLARKVSGKHFGIVGLGRIGLATAVRLQAFGKVSYTSPNPKSVPYNHVESLLNLAQEVNVLVVTAAANAATKNLINGEILNALGPSGYLINVSRGSVVDEQALIRALENKQIAGAALDVFADEPNVPNALVDSASTVLTPHIASATLETRTAMADLVLANLDAYLSGKPLPTSLN